MNPMMFLQLKNSWNVFQKNHPKFPLFLKKVSQTALSEGTIIEIKVSTEDGNHYSSNLKLSASDIELIRQIKESFENGQ